MQNQHSYIDPRWSFNLNDDQHNEFLRSIHNIQVILNDTVSLEHGYLERKTNAENEEEYSFTDFQPTTFIYAFFVLNILYNYNWPKSFSEKELLPYESLKEIPKIEKYTDFCLRDYSFVSFFKSRFKEILNYEFSIKKIEKAIESIKPDSRITDDDKNAFIESIGRIMNENDTDKFKDDVCQCLKFIYLIRCNVLHGTKSLNEMLNSEIECTKLKIYSWFLIASCQMFFSYLDSKSVPYYPINSTTTSTNTYKMLFKKLKENN